MLLTRHIAALLAHIESRQIDYQREWPTLLLEAVLLLAFTVTFVLFVVKNKPGAGYYVG